MPNIQQSNLACASNGSPIETLTASQTAGADGPIVLQDFTLLDHISHFDRERIPERVVHAKGAGAMGYFQVTDPEFIQSICKARVFRQPSCRVSVRFSTVGGESGSADTARDPRGFAIKFFTEEGVWDLVGNNTPIFFIRDPILFPRNPITHLKDPDAFWDFISLRPETIHQVSFLFSNRGTPDGYRFMNGYGSHTFVNVNDAGDVHYVKYHFKTDQGIRNLSAKEADRLASADPDYATRDLYDAIANGDYPSWTLYVQAMTPQQASQCPFNPFDLTKVWPHSDYPLRQVGRMVLNENPTDYFTQVEQLAFSPSHMVPGIEPSPDKMLQARLFSYPDTHRHRLGANYQQLPCNNHADVNDQYQRDGPMAYQVPKGGPNYFPNSFQGPRPDAVAGKWHDAKVSGTIGRYETGSSEDNFSQCRTFYNQVLSPAEREDLTQNMADHLSNAQEFIRENVIAVLRRVNSSYAAKVKEKIRPAVSTDRPKPPAAPLNPPRNVCPYGYKSKL